MPGEPAITRIEARAYRIPTEQPESDGTFRWDATGMVLVTAWAGDVMGLGYSYTQPGAAAALVRDTLAPLLLGRDALDLPARWRELQAALRNIGRPGLGQMALAAVDIALWDLKARLLGQPLPRLLGRARAEVPVYASGGFTSLSEAALRAQMEGWAEQGFTAMKMKVGSHAGEDPHRVRIARTAAGLCNTFMVDANGAYDRAQALLLAQRFAECGVSWFEEPLSSDNLAGLAQLRAQLPPGMALAAGEYGWDAAYFRSMLAAGAVDVLQADATRCGYTGFMQAAALCEAWDLPLSAHCAPAIHAPVCAAAPRLRHLEYFFDHQRIEALFFDGLPPLRHGALHPSDEAPGHGLGLREADADAYRIQ